MGSAHCPGSSEQKIPAGVWARGGGRGEQRASSGNVLSPEGERGKVSSLFRHLPHLLRKPLGPRYRPVNDRAQAGTADRPVQAHRARCLVQRSETHAPCALGLVWDASSPHAAH